MNIRTGRVGLSTNSSSSCCISAICVAENARQKHERPAELGERGYQDISKGFFGALRKLVMRIRVVAAGVNIHDGRIHCQLTIGMSGEQVTARFRGSLCRVLVIYKGHIAKRLNISVRSPFSRNIEPRNGCPSQLTKHRYRNMTPFPWSLLNTLIPPREQALHVAASRSKMFDRSLEGRN